MCHVYVALNDVLSSRIVNPRRHCTYCEDPYNPTLKFNVINGKKADVLEFKFIAAIGYMKEQKNGPDFNCGVRGCRIV